jgi:hypothetical protein
MKCPHCGDEIIIYGLQYELETIPVCGKCSKKKEKQMNDLIKNQERSEEEVEQEFQQECLEDMMNER